MAKDPDTVVELNVIADDNPDVPSSNIATRRSKHKIGNDTRQLARQGSIFNRRPNQFISLDYNELVDFLYSTIVWRQPSPTWTGDWKKLFCRQMPLYTTVRVAEDFRPLSEQYDALNPTPEKLSVAGPKHTLGPQAHSRPGSTTGPDAGDEAFQRLDNVDSEDIKDSHINPELRLPGAMGDGDHPPVVAPTGAMGRRPVEEGVPIQEGTETVDMANTFRRGNLDSLLATCGFQRISDDMVADSRKEVGRTGITVHLPDREDVAVRGYFRNVYKREVTTREATHCFSSRVEEETVFRALMFVYAYRLFTPPESEKSWCSLWCWKIFQKAKRRPVGPEGSEGKVFMHMYNSIPMADLDMLWPESVPNPTTLDVLFVAVPFLIGLVTSLYKIVELVVEIDDFTSWENLILILLAIVGPFSIAFKAYSRSKNKYYAYKAHHEKTLSQHTITTNGGALTYLLSDAAGQEAKEFVLAYTLLALAEEPLTVEQLRESANSLLQKAGFDEIDFDAEDALLELEKLGLLLREGDMLIGVLDLQPLQQAVSLAEFEEKVVGKYSWPDGEK